jgi:hypothetical protein
MYRVTIGKTIISVSSIQQQIAGFQVVKDQAILTDLNSQKSELIQIMASYLNQQATRVETIDKLTDLDSRTA